MCREHVSVVVASPARFPRWRREGIEPHVAAVVVANTRKLPQVSKAKAKTDRLDARTLARLAASGFLETVRAPDERARALRRLCARREALIRARTRAKNEAHAVPARNLCGRPPVSDCFGKQGRAWLAELQLPVDERLTLDGCLRQIDFLDAEIAALEAALAAQALGSPEILRLMTVPGVNLQTAAAFMGSVGDIRRFPSSRADEPSPARGSERPLVKGSDPGADVSV